MTADASSAATPAATAADHRHMARAIELAEHGRRTVSPNPLVGCVVVRDGAVVGEGWHRRAGEPHAEILALQAAGEHARGATAYVTLEPCNHTGRTGPCAAALAEAGVRRVVAAVADPHPVAHGGAAALRAAGVEVEIGLLADRARKQNHAFLFAIEHGRPLVVLKAATSLDGRIAAADGTSQWLTGAGARAAVHQLRADVDAVLVGSGTVLADDARLTARTPTAAAPPQPLRVVPQPLPVVPQPLRVVLDARGRTPPTARVLDGTAPTLVITTVAGRKRLPAGTDVAVVSPGAAGGVDLRAALAVLHEREIRSVLVEGGAEVASSLLADDLVDRLVLHLAPLVLGDRGRPLFQGGPATLADAARLRLQGIDRSGDDVLLSYDGPALLRHEEVS